MAAADIARVADWVLAAQRIAVLTGAGISTASGIPDFRSAAGIYATRASENVFDLELFHRDPLPFYRFAAWFYPLVAHAQPNAAHRVLADWERGGKHVGIATQNVDDLHQRAGSQQVHGVHGSWLTSTCLTCSKVWKTTEVAVPILGNPQHNLTDAAIQLLHCDCGGLLKPDITFFGEALPQAAWWHSMELMRAAELVLVLGTSLTVFPAAGLPAYRSESARLIIINREATPLDAEAHAVLRGDLADVMQRINDRAFQA